MMSIKNILILIIVLSIAATSYGQKTDYEIERNTMVENDIKARGIKNEKVLEAMRSVPRHLFVPKRYRKLAYADRPLPIGHSQTISQPYIVALMTALVNPKEDTRVLEIGTGSGYQAAVLAEICDTVYSIEIIPDLGKSARKRLHSNGYDNVKVKIGDGYQGWPKYAPFDAIIVTAAPHNVPKPLKEQLAEGGRMIIPVGSDMNQELYLIKKKDGEITEQDVIPVRFVPMINEEGGRH